MKSIFVAGLLMATSVFSAAVPVSAAVVSAVPQKRQLESQGSILDNLYQQIIAQTTQISKDPPCTYYYIVSP